MAKTIGLVSLGCDKNLINSEQMLWRLADAGYDIVNDLDAVMNEFDGIVGLGRIKVFHLNGSLNVRGAKKDRHANVGANADNPKGADNIGFDAIYRLVHSEYAKGRYLILETPHFNGGTNLYKEEIAMLRGELR